MSIRAEDIFQKIMEKAVDDAKPDSDSPQHLQRFHVSQTADQLPDIRKRNAFYRAELEKQIQEKREAERKRKEREAFEEERLLKKLESDREKLRREYLEEIRQRELLQEEAAKRQQMIAQKLAEIQEAEERKREEELRRRQEAAAKRIAELEEAMELKRLEEIEKRKQAEIERLYYSKYFRNGFWDSREYVNTALGVGSSSSGSAIIKRTSVGVGLGGPSTTSQLGGYYGGGLDDIYYAAPLPVLADVYRRLVYEKGRIKEVIKERIRDGEG